MVQLGELDVLRGVGSDAFGSATVLEVVGMGGGVNALGRHAVAAYLNALSGGVEYDLSTEQIVEMFNAASSGGDEESTKDTFEEYNEQECPL